MRIVDISSLQGGEVVGKAVFDNEGRILLQKGIQLKAEFISRLKQFKINSIYIDDEFSKDIDLPDLLSDESRLQLNSSIKNISDKLLQGKTIGYEGMSNVLNFVIDDILSQKEVMIMANEIRSKDDIIFSHSVNVCSMSIALGLRLGMDMSKLKELSIGALLHDCGKIQYLKDNNLTYSTMTPEQLDDMEIKHARIGYEILGKDSSFNPIAKVTVLMHHETEDGSGFPMKLNGSQIHQAAKIVGLCNTFDNLVYGTKKQDSIPVYASIEYLNAMSKNFSREILTSFLSIVAIYPNGTNVKLNSGEQAVVVKQNNSVPTRPVVRVFKDSNGIPIDSPYEINLLESLTTFIIS